MHNTKQAFWIGMGSFSSFALSIVSAAILSRYLSKGDYGTYKQVVYVYTIFLVLFSAGLPRVYSYYLPRHTLGQGRGLVRQITRILALFGCLFSVFLFAFSGVIADFLKNPELSTGLKIFSPIPMLLLPTLGLEGIFATYQKTIYVAVYETLTRLFMLGCIVLPIVIFGGSYLLAIYGWLGASVLSAMLAWKFKEALFHGVAPEKAHLSNREIFAYSLPLLTASLWGIAWKASDQFYVSRYFGREVFAEFSNGFIDLPFVAMITSAASTVLMPQFSRMVHEKADPAEIFGIWNRTLLQSAVLIYPCVIFFMFCAKDIIILLFGAMYIRSVVYFQIAMVLNFFNIIIFAPLILAMGEVKFYSNLHMGFAIAAWSAGYLAIVIFNDPVAVASVSVGLRIIHIIIAFLFVARRMNVSLLKILPLNGLAAIVVHSLLTMLTVTALARAIVPAGRVVLSLLVTSGAFAALLLSTAGFFKIDYGYVLASLKREFVKKRDAPGVEGQP